jgi:hypothetical protein
MKTFTYRSGEEVRTRDRITYHGEPGEVEFVVIQKIGFAAIDWYIEQCPGGGFMITMGSFGKVFLTEAEIDEDLDFVSRGDASGSQQST